MFSTPYLVNADAGDTGLEVNVFFIWGFTCAGCVAFVYLCVPETKGLSLEQIDLLYQNSHPVTSRCYHRQLIGDRLQRRDSESQRDYREKGKNPAAWVVCEEVPRESVRPLWNNRNPEKSCYRPIPSYQSIACTIADFNIFRNSLRCLMCASGTHMSATSSTLR